MNPYQKLPDYQFWRKSMAGLPWFSIDPVVKSSFMIDVNNKVATAGSCFAQHIAKNLTKSGFNYFVPEAAPVGMSVRESMEKNYGTYSARFGNLYTARQLKQLWMRTFEGVTFDLPEWRNKEGRFVDPFRPQIEKNGFETQEQMLQSMSAHLDYCRIMFEELDIFVFTMGLTEGWQHKKSGAVLPLAPGVAGGEWDPAEYEFVNFSVDEIYEDMNYVFSKLFQMNEKARTVLTVSPVPLIATYENKHVLVSTIYSKSVLRVVAEKLSIQFKGQLDYFPSYEIITSPATAGHYFEGDFREIAELGVDHVMRVFFKHYVQQSKIGEHKTSFNYSKEVQVVNKIVCDEESIDKARS